MSSWDILFCLEGDFNVRRFFSKRFTERRLTIAVTELLNFINSCSLIDPPFKGDRFTRPTHEELPILSRIDRFLFLLIRKITSRDLI